MQSYCVPAYMPAATAATLESYWPNGLLMGQTQTCLGTAGEKLSTYYALFIAC